MSQADCLGALGVTRQTIISIRKGRFDPRPSLAFRIAAMSEVAVDEVFTPA